MKSHAFLVGVFLFGAMALGACAGQDEAPPAQVMVPLELDEQSIRDRTGQLDLKASEDFWTRIAWVRSLERAEGLSKSTGRPIFFFSMYGELDGRC
jgi:hypothetical protein